MYQESGISHILVISGLNISMIGMALYQILKRIGLPQIPTSCLTILLIYYYGLLTEFSVSTNRAVVMLTLSLVAVMIGRTYDLISAMAFSAIIILFQSPLQINNSGFLLSFGAVLGIAYLAPGFRAIFPDKREKNTVPLKFDGIRKWIFLIIKEGFIITCATNLMTLPVILYYYFEFPLYGILINILLIPFMSLLVILAMIGGLVGCFWTFGGTFLMGGVHYILCIIEYICMLFSKLPFHTVIVGRPKLILIFFYYLILAIFLFIISHYPKNNVDLLFVSICFIYSGRGS